MNSYNVSNKELFYLALNFASRPGSFEVPCFQLGWDLSHTMNKIALLFDGILLSYFLSYWAKSWYVCQRNSFPVYKLGVDA